MKRFLSLLFLVPILLAAGANDRIIPPKKDGGAIVLQPTTSGGVATDAVTVTSTGMLTNVPVALKGDTSGTAASAGYVTETKIIALTSGSKIQLISGQWNDIGSVAVPEGRWSVSGAVYFYAHAANTSITGTACGVGTTSGNNDPNVGTDPISTGLYDTKAAYVPGTGVFQTFTIPSFLYIKSTSSSDIYLKVRSTFTVSGVDAYGFLQLKREP